MKSPFRFHLVWLMLLLSATFFTACKKETVEPVAPTDLADRVAGTYHYSELTMDGKTHPANETKLQGKVVVSRETASSVSFAFDVTRRDGGAFLDQTIDGVEVREENGELIYEIDGDLFAKGKGKKVMINVYDTANKLIIVTATR